MTMPVKLVAKDEAANSPSMDELYAIALRQSVFHNRYKRWSQAFTAQERPGGDLNVMQLWVLFLIRTEGAMPSTLARRLMVTPTVITGVVDRLERRGYLQRVDDRIDRRRVHLVLTPEGERVSQEAEQITFSHIASYMKDLTDEDLTTISRALDLFEETLARLEDAVKHTGDHAEMPQSA
jgi:DNA-binding MarR family transcriptional regulator